MVYGIIELINFAHGDLFMLGAFLALTIVGIFGSTSPLTWILLVVLVPLFTGGLNCLVERYAYRPLRRQSSRLAPLVSAIGVSFIFLNIGLFWGGLPLEVFDNGHAASAPKNFPTLFSSVNLFSAGSGLTFTTRDLLVTVITIPLLLSLSIFIKYSKTGMAMRAVAQNVDAARLMGIPVDKIISRTFFLGGALAGVASTAYALFNGTVFFQMGYRVGMDAFVAAVLGGIGSLFGACIGGLLIGVLRAFSDHYIATSWTNVVVFSVLIAVLIFRPGGIMGSEIKEKV
jgi:branched-chain amino acid transport system permease protein